MKNILSRLSLTICSAFLLYAPNASAGLGKSDDIHIAWNSAEQHYEVIGEANTWNTSSTDYLTYHAVYSSVEVSEQIEYGNFAWITSSNPNNNSMARKIVGTTGHAYHTYQGNHYLVHPAGSHEYIPINMHCIVYPGNCPY